MTYRGFDYYLELDINSAAEKIRKIEMTDRGRCECFREAINAIVLRSLEEVQYTESEVLRILGKPDRIYAHHIKTIGDVTIWEYDWVGNHGPLEYSSSTPFVFREGYCLGVERGLV